MKRRRYNEFVGTCVLPETRSALEDLAEKRFLSLSELTRQYIAEGIARDNAMVRTGAL